MSMLPLNWTKAKLGELVTLKTGPFGSALHKSDYLTGGVPVINPTHIKDGKIIPSPEVTVSPIIADRLSEYRLDIDDVVMGRRGEMGRCALVSLAHKGWLCGTGSVIVKPTKALNPKYLQRFLTSPVTVTKLNGDSVGSTMVNLNQGVVLALEARLPPLAEQKRIVDKLDTVLARVDACRERLNRVPLILKRFRQSVLAAATSGQLTADWREANVSPIEISAGDQLTVSDWKCVSLNAVCQSITDGDHQAPPQSSSGIPFITISAINDGQLRLEKASRYVPREYFDQLKSLRKPASGDVLFSVTGSICIPALVSEEAEFTFQRHIAILKPNLNEILSKYLYFVLGSDHIKKQGLEIATGTAQLTVPLSGLRNFQIQQPPLKEQQEIVRRVETLFAFADRLEARIATARTATDRLTPALLAKAFRGELVPQDPSDEPAAELLKRLAAARTATSDKPRRGRAAKVGKRPSDHPSQVCDS